MYTLKITEVSIMDKTATNLARLRAYDENPWDESEHPKLRMGVLPLALVMNLILLAVNLILQIFSRKGQAKLKKL